MSWPSIVAIVMFFAKLWTALWSKGYRVEVRSEASIDADRKRLDRLAARIKGIDNELQETVIKLVAAQAAEREARRKQDDNAYIGAHLEWVACDVKRQRLLGQLGDARQEYVNARGVPDI